MKYHKMTGPIGPRVSYEQFFKTYTHRWDFIHVNNGYDVVGVFKYVHYHWYAIYLFGETRMLRTYDHRPSQKELLHWLKENNVPFDEKLYKNRNP